MNFVNRMKIGYLRAQRDWRLLNLTKKVAAKSHPRSVQKPVLMFNASTRLGGFSQNAAFSLLTSWGLQLAGVPVVHFACRAGMSRCVLGTNPDDYAAAPPCKVCIAQSKKLYSSAPVRWFDYQSNNELFNVIKDLSLETLSTFEFKPDGTNLSFNGVSIPLGDLVLSSLRWALRRYHLQDDEPTRYLLREYVLSAYRVAEAFDQVLDEVEPKVAVIFNGLQFPEAIAKWVAKRRGIRVITYEVSFTPFSAFFTDGEATAYPIKISETFKLSPEQDAKLDNYLRQRFKGDFTMAGIRFWPEINGLNDDFLSRAGQFKQIVPVFTNVIFDTSQKHANVVFPHMFAWLDSILEVIRKHQETLFVIRAHPDEKRPGTRKQARESVSDWVDKNKVSDLNNVIFYDSNEYINSYELIKKGKFIAIYNSSIGLEATILGVPVLCGGKARFTQYPIVFFPKSIEAYSRKMEQFLDKDTISLPEEFVDNARKFLYHQLFKVSLPFGEFLEAHPTPGYVQLKRFSWKKLRPEHSETIKVITEGILNRKPFVMPDRLED
ncbi:MAG TPA: hypothetical protein G4N95_08200 [Anaerolineae bacterium]|nr:hypothetical protein [Anaerolineae bacterium]